MPKFKEYLREKIKRLLGGEIPLSEGFYFYVIMFVSLAVPFAILACILFLDMMVAMLVPIFLVFFVVWILACVHVYKKIKQQFRQLHESILQLEFSDRDHEISVLGGLLTIRVEESNKQLPPPTPPMPPALEGEMVVQDDQLEKKDVEAEIEVEIDEKPAGR